MPSVPCPLTGAPSRLYCRRPPAEYYLSGATGLIFQKETPAVGEMAAHADEKYASGEYRGYVAAAHLKYATFEKRMRLISGRARGGRLLDVGCSAGFLIETALKHGFDARGVEFSREAIARAKPEIRDRITHGDVNQLQGMAPGGFDVITAFDIIEHTQDPVQFLRTIRALLSPGGWLVLTTPDTGHWLRYLLGARWPMLQPLQHTFLFSRKAMRMALDRAGFPDGATITGAGKTITPDYIVDQIRPYIPALAALYGAAARVIPAGLRRRPISVNIGEMLVMCRNEGGC